MSLLCFSPLLASLASAPLLVCDVAHRVELLHAKSRHDHRARRLVFFLRGALFTWVETRPLAMVRLGQARCEGAAPLWVPFVDTLVSGSGRLHHPLTADTSHDTAGY